MLTRIFSPASNKKGGRKNWHKWIVFKDSTQGQVRNTRKYALLLNFTKTCSLTEKSVKQLENEIKDVGRQIRMLEGKKRLVLVVKGLILEQCNNDSFQQIRMHVKKVIGKNISTTLLIKGVRNEGDI